MPVDKSFIGGKDERVTMHVLYFDEAYAQRVAGGIMPAVTILRTERHWDDGRGRPRPPFELKRALHGGQEYEFLAPEARVAGQDGHRHVPRRHGGARRHGRPAAQGARRPRRQDEGA